jgi:hypothetical protein
VYLTWCYSLDVTGSLGSFLWFYIFSMACIWFYISIWLYVFPLAFHSVWRAYILLYWIHMLVHCRLFLSHKFWSVECSCSSTYFKISLQVSTLTSVSLVCVLFSIYVFWNLPFFSLFLMSGLVSWVVEEKTVWFLLLEIIQMLFTAHNVVYCEEWSMWVWKKYVLCYCWMM